MYSEQDNNDNLTCVEALYTIQNYKLSKNIMDSWGGVPDVKRRSFSVLRFKLGSPAVKHTWKPHCLLSCF